MKRGWSTWVRRAAGAHLGLGIERDAAGAVGRPANTLSPTALAEIAGAAEASSPDCCGGEPLDHAVSTLFTLLMEQMDRMRRRQDTSV